MAVTRWGWSLLWVLLLTPSLLKAERVLYFPSVLFGHILIGDNASRYQTTLVIAVERPARVSITLFDDQGRRQKALLRDASGEIISSSGDLEVPVTPGAPIRLRLGLDPADERSEISVRTGWLSVRSTELAVDASVRVRIEALDGRTVNQYSLLPERPAQAY